MTISDITVQNLAAQGRKRARDFCTPEWTYTSTSLKFRQSVDSDVSQLPHNLGIKSQIGNSLRGRLIYSSTFTTGKPLEFECQESKHVASASVHDE
jgi:hypothetical protein